MQPDRKRAGKVCKGFSDGYVGGPVGGGRGRGVGENLGGKEKQRRNVDVAIGVKDDRMAVEALVLASHRDFFVIKHTGRPVSN